MRPDKWAGFCIDVKYTPLQMIRALYVASYNGATTEFMYPFVGALVQLVFAQKPGVEVLFDMLVIMNKMRAVEGAFCGSPLSCPLWFALVYTLVHYTRECVFHAMVSGETWVRHVGAPWWFSGELITVQQWVVHPGSPMLRAIFFLRLFAFRTLPPIEQDFFRAASVYQTTHAREDKVTLEAARDEWEKANGPLRITYQIKPKRIMNIKKYRQYLSKYMPEIRRPLLAIMCTCFNDTEAQSSEEHPNDFGELLSAMEDQASISFDEFLSDSRKKEVSGFDYNL
jgi:hypothetical protein